MPEERKPQVFISHSYEESDAAKDTLQRLKVLELGHVLLNFRDFEKAGEYLEQAIAHFVAARGLAPTASPPELEQAIACLTEARSLGERRLKGAFVPAAPDLMWSFRRLEPGTVSEFPSRDLLIENERLKTQLIEQRRALLLADRSIADLRKQNERLVDVVCDATSANKALQGAMLAQREGRLCLHETHRGVVSAVVGEQIEVTYETAEGPLKQIYQRDQFIGSKLPQEGDSVEAHVMLSTVLQPKPQEQAGTMGQRAEERPDFRTQNTAETIRI